MPSVYLANVIGDGSMNDGFRPDVPTGADFSCLMIDGPAGRCVIVSPSDSLTGTGILLLATGSTWDDLAANTRQTSPNNPTRNQINNWLTTAGYQPISAGMTWDEVIHFVARQVNPAANLGQTKVN